MESGTKHVQQHVQQAQHTQQQHAQHVQLAQFVQPVQEPVVQVDVDALHSADSPRILGESTDHVEALATAHAELPPIIVHRPTNRVIDGMHRLKAARLRRQGTIGVRFFDGDAADAFVVAVSMNIAHGLPLSLADRKQAAERIMTSHPQWSDRMVAAVTGIAARTVAGMRKRVPGVASADSARIGQDGRVRPVNRAVGRRLASALMTENPGLSLRQIAQAAGISPETARDVRNRLSRGEDPVPGERGAGGCGGRPARAAAPAAPPEPPPVDRAMIKDRALLVARLRADPSLRFSESGRTLLRLLNMHTLEAAGWDHLVDHVPPHWGGVVAQLARDHAKIWAEFAAKVERQVTPSP
ncbi:ParB/RepB/Spo0J family partition protein [Streptomyces sp. NPDC001985]|uniref:ParB/RepB/Spo0J family partition protein n=1 Tax=Streptomyces sp. NPDC001985 TaxID=3154406 RepID=UPI00332544AE